MPSKWDFRFLGLAEHVSAWSKDPSTKVGAVIVDKDMRVISLGYNGFPMRTSDAPLLYANREEKYRRVVHAEMNAMSFARRDLSGCSLYTWPFMSCPRCAGVVIQSGITRHVAPVASPEIMSRWKDDLEVSTVMFAEAGVELELVELV